MDPPQSLPHARAPPVTSGFTASLQTKISIDPTCSRQQIMTPSRCSWSAAWTRPGSTKPQAVRNVISRVEHLLPRLFGENVAHEPPSYGLQNGRPSVLSKRVDSVSGLTQPNSTASSGFVSRAFAPGAIGRMTGTPSGKGVCSRLQPYEPSVGRRGAGLRIPMAFDHWDAFQQTARRQ